MIRGLQILSLAVAILCGNGLPARAADWGNLTGTFLYGGDIPKSAKLTITKDVEVCGKFNLVDESLTVNEDNKGLANVVVYMYLGRRDDPPAIHESYNADSKGEVTLDNLNCAFEPRVALLQTSQKLLIGNKDPIAHNTKVDAVANVAINPIIPAGQEQSHQFKESERIPVKVSCSIHPWMTGWLLVKDNPYFAVTDENGKFEIKNIPAGKWTFQAWQEKSGYIEQVKKGSSTEKWRKGRVEITIDAGGTDLGELTVPAAAFEG